MAHGKKTGGRQKGTPNIITSEIRDNLKSILDSEIKQIPSLLNELDTEKRLNLLVKLLPYVLPRLESVSITNEQENTPLFSAFDISPEEIRYISAELEKEY